MKKDRIPRSLFAPSSDRPLQHINKKGRPVSQCPHCRGLRKARSSHVRCECGEKDPLMKRELMGKNILHTYSHIKKLILAKSDAHSCGCGHGQRCICNLKKEHLEPISEFKHTKGRSRANTEGRKPRLTANISDPSMTIFTNGHHKPVHRNNHAGHDYSPYKISRPHSIHGHGSLAQRSMENLTLNSGYGNSNSMFTTALSNLHRGEERLVRSAHGSPGLYPSRFDRLDRFDRFGQLPNLDLNFPAYNTSVTSSPSGDEYTQSFPSTFEPYTSQIEEPPRSAPINASFHNWSAGDLPLDVGTLPSTYNQPPSYASFDHSHVSGADLTTSSGELSDVEDFGPQTVISPNLGRESPFIASPTDNVGRYGSSEPFPNVQGAFNPMFDTITMEPFTPRSPGSPFDPHELSTTISPDSEPFTRHAITVQEAQKLAHAGYTSVPITVHNPIAGQPVIPITTAAPTSDPSWAAEYLAAEDESAFIIQPSIQIQRQTWMT